MPQIACVFAAMWHTAIAANERKQQKGKHMAQLERQRISLEVELESTRHSASGSLLDVVVSSPTADGFEPVAAQSLLEAVVVGTQTHTSPEWDWSNGLDWETLLATDESFRNRKIVETVRCPVCGCTPCQTSGNHYAFGKEINRTEVDA